MVYSSSPHPGAERSSSSSGATNRAPVGSATAAEQTAATAAADAVAPAAEAPDLLELEAGEVAMGSVVDSDEERENGGDEGDDVGDF